MLLRALVLTLLVVAVAGCGGASSSSPAERGSHYLRAGQYDDAITALSDAIRANPVDADSFFNRGRAHHYRGDVGDLERAVEDFTDVIRLAPKDPEAFYSRSMAYRDLAAQYEASGDKKKAAEYGALSAEDQKMARGFDPRVHETYSQLPDTSPPSNLRIESVPVEEPAAAGEAQPSLDDILNSSRRGEIKPPSRPLPKPSVAEEPPREDVRDLYRRQQEQAAARRRAESQAATEKSPRGELESSRPSDLRLNPRRSRLSSDSRTAGAPREPDLPPALRNPRSAPIASPYGPRNPYGEVGADGRPSPYQNPYAPRASNPTGITDDLSSGPYRTAPRTLYDRPAGAPSNRTPIAPDYDFERP